MDSALPAMPLKRDSKLVESHKGSVLQHPNIEDECISSSRSLRGRREIESLHPQAAYVCVLMVACAVHPAIVVCL